MKTLLLGLATFLLMASPAFAEVHVTMHDGRVSIVAKDATVRQILTEWARVGQTRIVNVERIPGGPVTLQLDNVTEMHALEVLLRPLSGFIAAPRSVAAANLSDFDRIIIMPTLADARPAPPVSASAQAAATAFAPPVYQPPVYQPPAPVVQSVDDDPISDAPLAGGQSVGGGNPQTAAAAAAQAVAATSAQTVAAGAPVMSAGESTPTSYPRGLEVGRRVIDPRITSRPPVPGAPPLPTGVAVPGMIAPGAPQPGQPGQPVRRPGGP
jgi:hypothetical protein